MAAAVAARSEKAVEDAGQDVSPRSVGGAVSDDESPYPEEARFFGVCPLRFIEDILNAVDDYINDAVDEAEKDLAASMPPTSAIAASRGGAKKIAAAASAASRSAAVTQCCDALVDLLRRKFDIHLDLFEMYALRNIFRVPSDLQEGSMDDMLAPTTAYTEEDEEQVDLRLEDLRTQIREARHRRRGLLSTVSLFEKRLPRFERKASTVEALHAAFASAGVTDPDATMRDMLGKIEEMQRAERAATEHLHMLNQRAATPSPSPGHGDAATMEGLESTFEEDRHLVGDVGDMRMRDVTHHMGASVDDEHL